MRYTTIIDITTMPAVYKNHNCRMVYLHMCLKSGYRDTDRDLIQVSIRNLAYEVGISVSATRHALDLLQRAQLIKRQGPLWAVRKFIFEETITPRAKTKKQQQERQQTATREEENRQREAKNEENARYREELRKQGKTSFMVWYEDKMKQAAAGDVDAQNTVARHKAAYEEQKAALEQSTNNK